MSAGHLETHTTHADGRSIVSSELGDPHGYPVIWCHGGLSSRVDIELAREGFDGLGVRLITIDRPGIGKSDRDKGRTVASWSGDATAVADDLDIQEFAVVGWSAGAPHALACAAALPTRVTAVATIGGMAPVRSRADVRALGLGVDRLLIPLAHHAPWLATLALETGRRAKPERLKARTLKTLPMPDQALLQPLPAERAVGYGIAALHDGVRGTVDDYRAFGGDWRFALEDVHHPVRCWRGTEDTLVSPEDSQRLVGALPRATLHPVPDTGHFLFVEHTAEVFGALLEDAGA